MAEIIPLRAPPPSPRIIGFAEVYRLTNLSRDSIDRLRREEDKQKRFPEPLEFKHHVVGWYEDEVIDWLNRRRSDRRLPSRTGKDP